MKRPPESALLALSWPLARQASTVRGDYPLSADSSRSIELNATHSAREWGDQAVRSALEEDAFPHVTDGQWVARRQSEFHRIR